MNRTDNCYKNHVHNHSKQEEGVQHCRYEYRFGRSPVLFKSDYQQVSFDTIVILTTHF